MVKAAGSQEYPFRVGPGLLESVLPEFIRERKFASAAIVTNHTLVGLYGESLTGRIGASFLIDVPDGEQYKTLATVQTIYDQLLENNASRSTPVIALGGGVIGDMAGFAAATFMRGVPIIQVPTTLLAMVDASVGSKVGVDLPQGKNLIGAFKDPLAIFADTATLDTLPPVEFACGLAEVVKAGLIGDPALLDDLEARGPQPIDEVIRRAVAVKIDIVRRDPFETGERALLNLGHTFAHALEVTSGYALRHGEAVSVGLAAATRLSVRHRLCDPALVERVERLLSGLSLPIRYHRPGPEAIWNVMQHDKKWSNNEARFILIKAAGQPVSVTGVARSDVLAVLESLAEGS